MEKARTSSAVNYKPGNSYWIHAPHTKQQIFLDLDCIEALYGGSAGGGKSDALLMDALTHVHIPGYAALLLRRTYKDLALPGAIMDRSKEWLMGTDAHWNEQQKTWTFPSDATITFGYLDTERDKYRYQSSEFQFIGFDELTQFMLTQYTYLFSRLRRLIGVDIPLRMRAGSNPGGVGHEWVKQRFLNERVDGRVFIRAGLDDNPHIDKEEYLKSLSNLDTTTLARLRDGDWNVGDEGIVYNNFGAESNITTDAEYTPTLDVYWGVDDGYARGQGIGTLSYHPRVILLGQVTPQGGLNIFYEYYAVGEVEEITLQNVEALDYPLPAAAYVDSSAAQLRSRIWALGVQTVSATHKVSEGVKNVRRLICDGNNVRLLRVHPRCTQLIRELQSYRYDDKSTQVQAGEPKPLKLDDHGPDALRYLAWMLRYE